MHVVTYARMHVCMCAGMHDIHVSRTQKHSRLFGARVPCRTGCWHWRLAACCAWRELPDLSQQKLKD